MQNFKPLLAEKADLDAVRFPVMASPKIDGIRAHTGILDTICSRNLKSIPNRHIREQTKHLPAYLDGELLTYTNGKRDDFNTVQSKVMSEDGEPEFIFHVFDSFIVPSLPFSQRYTVAQKVIGADLTMTLELVPHKLIADVAELAAFEQEMVDVHGWEGVMLRDPSGPYKFGRSTAKEGILLKVKRFQDDEAVITGSVERMHNGNEATKNALGYTERSSAKAGLVGTNTLGALQATWNGVDFEIGTGFDDALRQELWDRRESLVGQKVTFKFQGVGSNGRPRFPVFIGLRKDI